MDETWVWWKHGVIYQIYPRSFYDSNGDGVGDIPGIIAKLDYLARLGVDGVWLSPVYPSPMRDFGYDVSDYRGIDPVFGTLEDFDRLLAEAHRRGLRIIMDMVLNHTSDAHPWFAASRSSRDDPRRDWYIWRDGRKDGPPNNWLSAFGGSAWEWDGATGQYYLHSFLPEQPDLNWRSPALNEAMFNELRFWLERGVDGFRLDVINWIVKDDRFRDNPRSLFSLDLQRHRYDRNRPEAYDIARELRRLVDSYGDRMLVGEVFALPPGSPVRSARFLCDGEGLHLAFDFNLLYQPWSARRWYRSVRRWLSLVPRAGWACHVLSNHDQPRAISRFEKRGETDRRARVAAAFLLTVPGAPFLYYGEEIGMRGRRISRAELQDPLGKRYWPLYAGRDPSRTPMQWSAGANAGFTTGTSWLPPGPDLAEANVSDQIDDRYSLLNFYRALIALRRRKPALHGGNWVPLAHGFRGVIAYYRECGAEVACVVLNFSSRRRRISLHGRAHWKVLLSTHRPRYEHFLELRMELAPCEATILEMIGGARTKKWKGARPFHGDESRMRGK